MIIGGILAGVSLSVLPNLPPEVSSKIESVLFDHKGDIFLIPVTLLLIFLFLTVLISFLGCFGSCLGSRCLMGLYFAVLLVLLLSSVGLTVSVLVLDVETAGGNILNGTIPLYNDSADIQAFWDTIQHRLHCCGTDSYKDWNDLENNFCFIPESCERNFRSNQTLTYLQNTSSFSPPCSLEDTADIYDTGCLELLTASPTTSLLLTLLPLITGAVLLVNVLCSLALCSVLDYADYTFIY